MRNLALAFCSVRPSQLSDTLCNAREEEYEICLRQLARVLPDSYDLVVCENTVDKESEFTRASLVEFLKEHSSILMGSKFNIGTVNKGLGELLMLKVAIDNIDISQYRSISYITARRIFTCPYVFEKTESLDSDALISNPDFLYVDGRFVESHKEGMYNDMFFSMKSGRMKEYADETYSRLQYMSDNSIGSEQNLFNFIKEKNVSHEWINWLGMVRNDWQNPENPLDVKNIHIC